VKCVDRGGQHDVVVVCAIDDHPMILRGLRSYFEAEAPCVSLTEIAPTVDALLAERGDRAGVVLLDVSLNDGTTVADNVARLAGVGLRVLLYTADHRPAVVRRALDAGALGLVLKEDPESRIVEAIHEAAQGRVVVSSAIAHQITADPRGGIRLSDREVEVLALLARGLPWTTIARSLGTSAETARTHCYRAIEKYIRAGAAVALGPKDVAFQAVADGHVEAPDLTVPGAIG
jgi:DNA-binding NarL/FixJ family response regulator